MVLHEHTSIDREWCPQLLISVFKFSKSDDKTLISRIFHDYELCVIRYKFLHLRMKTDVLHFILDDCKPIYSIVQMNVNARMSNLI